MYEMWQSSWLGWHKGAGFHSSASHQTTFFSEKGKTFPTIISSSFSTAPFAVLTLTEYSQSHFHFLFISHFQASIFVFTGL